MSVFLFAFIGSVVAMSEPITIVGDEGNNFRFYIRDPDANTLLYFESEDFDEGGAFSKTFFTLNEPNPKYQVKIFSGGNLIADETFEGYGINNPLTIDCAGSGCSISAGTPENTEDEEVVDGVASDEGPSIKEIVDEEVLDETGGKGDKDNLDENFEEDIIPETNMESAENEPSKFPFTGMNIFDSEDGSTSWGYIIGGIFSFLLMIFVIVMMMHRGKKSKEEPTEDNSKKEDIKKDLDPEERELEELGKKIKKREEEIKKIKEKRVRHQKLIEAKEKLKQEESEINNLVSEDDKVKEAKRKLQAREQVLENLKREINQTNENIENS